MIFPTGRVYLDCCAVLNVYATRRFDEILIANRTSATPSFAVAERVLTQEALFVRNGPAVDPDREVVDLRGSIDSGVLAVERLETEEESATFVGLAATLDDGEAETGALAFHRSGAVATDDAAAIRVLSALARPVAVVRTSALMKRWADRSRHKAAVVRQALNDIRDRAQFVPGGSDPLRRWWIEKAA